MRLMCIVLAFCCALPAHAEDCHAEIEALFDGPLDPFQRPPHRQEVHMFDADGNETRRMSNTIETPLRTIAGDPAAQYFTMAIDRDLWSGPTPDGPWTSLGYQMPEGREADIRRGNAEERENLTDIICHDPGEDGLRRYTYRTQTTPGENGAFYGALTTVTLDPEVGQIVRFEMSEFINSWSDGISEERQDIAVIFDPEIKVNPPE